MLSAVLAAVLLWPATRGGYLLGHDMVFTPQQPLDLASIGVSSASPRAVPLDALVALAEHVLGGAAVGRLALLIPLLAAGTGAALVLRDCGVPARLGCGAFAVWNPYVVERLALGQWALLWSYAALPWVIVVLTRLRGAAGWAALAVTIAAASITPTGGVIVAVTAVVVGAGGRFRTAGVAGLALALQLPWLVPALVSTAAATSDPGAVAAFAARGEFAGGPLLSLLGGGGVWNAEVVPASRGGVLPWAGLIVLLATGVLGARRLATSVGTRVLRALAVLAVTGLLLAVAASVPGADAVVRAAVAHVPGAGLLRDAQKWVLPLVLLEALLVGAALQRLADRVRAVNWRVVLLVAAVAVPVLLLPDGASPVRAVVTPVHYPADWAMVVARARGGTATVVPFDSYRSFAWVPGSASVLDPAPRLLQVPTVVQDRLAVSGRLLAGEDPRAAAIQRAFAADRPASRLAALGVRWVVVEHGTPGAVPDLTGLRAAYRGRDVSLYEVTQPVADVAASTGRAAAVIVADVAALAVLAALLGWALVAVRRRGPQHGAAAEAEAPDC